MQNLALLSPTQKITIRNARSAPIIVHQEKSVVIAGTLGTVVDKQQLD